MAPLVLKKAFNLIMNPNTLRLRQNGCHFAENFSNWFSFIKTYEFQIKFHWSLFLRAQLTIFQHWFRYWLGTNQATSHYLNQWCTLMTPQLRLGLIKGIVGALTLCHFGFWDAAMCNLTSFATYDWQHSNHQMTWGSIVGIILSGALAIPSQYQISITYY